MLSLKERVRKTSSIPRKTLCSVIVSVSLNLFLLSRRFGNDFFLFFLFFHLVLFYLNSFLFRISHREDKEEKQIKVETKREFEKINKNKTKRKAKTNIWKWMKMTRREKKQQSKSEERWKRERGKKFCLNCEASSFSFSSYNPPFLLLFLTLNLKP